MALYVHLASPEAIAAHIALAAAAPEGHPDREKSRSSALAEEGLWHKVERHFLTAGTPTADEFRTYFTACGIVQDEKPERMDEAEVEPGGPRCPKCFNEKGK